MANIVHAPAVQALSMGQGGNQQTRHRRRRSAGPRLQTALGVAFGPELADADPALRPSRFADVQVNAPMSLAKRLGMAPREVATKLVGALDVARTLEALGHLVLRQNHTGVWGTPFGMLIEQLLDSGRDSDEARLLTEDPNAYQRLDVKLADEHLAGESA